EAGGEDEIERVVKIRGGELGDALERGIVAATVVVERIEKHPGPERVHARGKDGHDGHRPESPGRRTSAGEPGDGLGQGKEAEQPQPEDEASVKVGPERHEQRQQPELDGLAAAVAIEPVEEEREEEKGELPWPGAEIRQPEKGGPEDERGGGDLVGPEMAQQAVEDRIGERHDDRREQDDGAKAAEPVEVEHAQLPEPFVRDPGTACGREGERVDVRNCAALGDELTRAQVPPEIDVGRPGEIVGEDRHEHDHDQQGPMAHALSLRARMSHRSGQDHSGRHCWEAARVLPADDPSLMHRVSLLRLVQGCLAGLALGTLVTSARAPAAYRTDLQVEYLTASAWRDGGSIFTPLTELSARYFPVATDNFPHASPHPPVLAPLGLPLTWLPFPVTVFLWLLVNVALLVRVGRWLGLSVLGSLTLLAWPPPRC